jgi:hypothetical protein
MDIQNCYNLENFDVTSGWIGVRCIDVYGMDDEEIVRVKNGNFKVYHESKYNLFVIHSEWFDELASGEDFLNTLKNQPWGYGGRIHLDRGLIGVLGLDHEFETEESFDEFYWTVLDELDNKSTYVSEKGVAVEGVQGGHVFYTIQNKDNLTIGILVNLEDCGYDPDEGSSDEDSSDEGSPDEDSSSEESPDEPLELYSLLLILLDTVATDPSNECCICFNNTNKVKFLPCNHKCCAGCTVQLIEKKQKCPYCREKIKDIVLIN